MRRKACWIWGVALVALLLGAWAPVASAAPTLTAVDPTDGSTGKPVTQTMVWKVASGDEDLSSRYTYRVRWGATQNLENDSGVLTFPLFSPGTLSSQTTYHWRVEATALAGSGLPNLVGGLWRFATGQPLALTPLDPANEATDVAVPTKTLLWSVTQGDDDVSSRYTYEVRWGDSAAMANSQRGLTAPVCTITGLKFNTTYYWRVVATPRAGGNAITGPIWRFATAEREELIMTFEGIEPADNAKDVRPNVSCRWDCTLDGLSIGGLRFDVRLGTTPHDLATVARLLADKLFHPTTLAYEKTYYWQIIAHGEDQLGDPMEWHGPIWKFTTGREHSEDWPLDGGGGCALGTLSPLEGCLFLVPFLAIFSR